MEKHDRISLKERVNLRIARRLASSAYSGTHQNQVKPDTAQTELRFLWVAQGNAGLCHMGGPLAAITRAVLRYRSESDDSMSHCEIKNSEPWALMVDQPSPFPSQDHESVGSPDTNK
jgi:hypothetical protein